jgi:hypothetical protein
MKRSVGSSSATLGRLTLENVMRAATGTARFASPSHFEENARVLVPGRAAGGRAAQREVEFGDLDGMWIGHAGLPKKFGLEF